jgi:alpha-1,2-mannosyltransferase
VWIIVVLAVLARRQRAGAAAALLFFFWFPTVWMLYTMEDFQELTFPWWKAVLSAIYVIAGSMVLLGEVVQRPRSALMKASQQSGADESAEPVPSSL